MRTLVYFLFAGLSVICHAQDASQVLFLRDSDPPEHRLQILVFHDNTARDTIHGYVMVTVTFNENISDPIRSVKSVEIERLTLTSKKNVNIDYYKYNDALQINCKERELLEKYKNKCTSLNQSLPLQDCGRKSLKIL